MNRRLVSVRGWIILAALLLCLVPLAGRPGAQSDPSQVADTNQTLISNTRATLELMRGVRVTISLKEGTVGELIEQIKAACPVPVIVSPGLDVEYVAASIEFGPTHGSLADLLNLIQDMGLVYWEARGGAVRLSHPEQYGLHFSRIGYTYDVQDILQSLVRREVANRSLVTPDSPSNSSAEELVAEVANRIYTAVYHCRDRDVDTEWPDSDLQVGPDGLLLALATPDHHVRIQDCLARLRKQLTEPKHD